MGTNDFTFSAELAVGDYTPTAYARIFSKFQDASNLVDIGLVDPSGTVRARAIVGGVTLFSATSTVATGLTDGRSAKITVVVIRETASAAGSVTFYVDGAQLGSAVAITAAATVSISNSGAAVYMGLATSRLAAALQGLYLFNRALSASEVLDLSINGPALADMGASQLELVTDGSFTGGPSGWTVDTGVAITDIGGGDYEAVFTASGTNTEFWRAPVANITTGRYRVTYTITSYTAGTFRPNIAGVVGTTRSSAGTFTEEVLITSIGAQRVGVRGTSASNTARIDDLSIVRVGCTLQLDAKDAQSNTGQIFDSSGNKNHALLPASGATVVGRPVSQTREVRWTNTWAGTNELQYIGGVNQAILPANAYIDSIVGTVSGATPHDIIVGDGSDTDRYVTITTGLATGTTTFTLANRTTDGTNLKLTVDPDTNATMSIAWVISYKTLES